MSQQTESQNNSLEKTIAVTASLLYKTPAAAGRRQSQEEKQRQCNKQPMQ
jgi:hypothetical protein